MILCSLSVRHCFETSARLVFRWRAQSKRLSALIKGYANHIATKRGTAMTYDELGKEADRFHTNTLDLFISTLVTFHSPQPLISHLILRSS